MRKWKYVEIDICKIEESKINANVMSKEEFDQLVDNIRVGGLSSVPAFWHRKEDDKYITISGHHRVAACKKLAFTKIPGVYVEEDEISEEEKIATQLSHNSLHGEDNKGILKRMFEEIQSVEFKKFAFINMDEIANIPVYQGSVVPFSEHYNVSFVLYKNDLETLEELVGIVQEDMANSDLVILADQDNTESLLLELIKAMKKKCKIKSANIALCKILELAKAKFDEGQK